MIQSKMRKQRSGSFIRILVVLSFLAVIGFAGWQMVSNHQGGSKAKAVMATLEEIIPNLGVDTGTSAGIGRDPLAAISIEGIDIVGVLEIPSLNIKAPVTGQSDREEFFASWLDGSPVKGNFQVVGNKDDLFRRLAKLKPGDRAYFTDIDGVRYAYEVKTQYHLKRWDVGDNDLLLCYETDSDTYFVVGCSLLQ